jgi:hypothetical protein
MAAEELIEGQEPEIWIRVWGELVRVKAVLKGAWQTLNPL